MQKPVIGVSMPLSPTPLGTLGPQRTFFNCQGLGRQANPAIQASYLPAQTVAAGDTTRSSGPLVQAGFEHVLLPLQGRLQVQDSHPDGAIDCAADEVLWQGHGHGQQTETRVAPDLARDGGTIEALSLWINLPARYKHTDPHRQWLPAADIPVLPLPGEAGTLRLIAGEYAGQTGPAETVTPLQLWDLRVRAGQRLSLPLMRGWYAQVFLLQGRLRLDLWPSPVTAPQLLALDRAGDELCFETEQDCRLVLLCCEPLAEDIVSHEGLILATPEQLQQARERLGV